MPGRATLHQSTPAKRAVRRIDTCAAYEHTGLPGGSTGSGVGWINGQSGCISPVDVRVLGRTGAPKREAMGRSTIPCCVAPAIEDMRWWPSCRRHSAGVWCVPAHLSFVNRAQGRSGGRPRLAHVHYMHSSLVLQYVVLQLAHGTAKRRLFS